MNKEIKYSKTNIKLFNEEEKTKLNYGNNIHKQLEEFDFNNLELSLNKLPENLRLAEKLPEPIFTPSTKGEKDENITFDQMTELVGKDVAHQVRVLSMRLYTEGAEYALSKGIIIADTKFEFGLDDDGVVTLIDEVLTPDSSRFWDAEAYKVGESPKSYDKQLLRDWITNHPTIKSAIP